MVVGCKFTSYTVLKISFLSLRRGAQRKSLRRRHLALAVGNSLLYVFSGNHKIDNVINERINFIRYKKLY